MKRFCTNCFRDNHIKTIISKCGEMGRCDYCGSFDVPTLCVSDADIVSNMMLGLVQTYKPVDGKGSKELKNSLAEDWDIFSLPTNLILELIQDLCADYFKYDDELYCQKVSIPQIDDSDFINEYGIFRGLSWKNFSDYIKYTNRFHNKYFNADAFSSFLSALVKVYPAKSEFYRARVCENEKAMYGPEQMGMPPKGNRKEGRINPKEIGVLYLALSDETVLYEVRASKFDRVTVGTFVSNVELKIIDLSGIEALSPFEFQDDNMIERYAMNRGIFKDIANELAKPMRRSDDPFDYLPTQFIAEFVKCEGYDGVAYKSTIHYGGYNIAIFDENKVSCVGTEIREIIDVKYKSI